MKKIEVDFDLLGQEEEETKDPIPEEETKEETKETEDTEEELPVEEEIEEETEEEEEENFFSTINRSLGIEVDIDDLKDEEKSLIEYIKRASSTMGSSQVNELFERFPDVKEYTEYRLNNGDPNKFFKTVTEDIDYNKLEIEEDQVNLQKQVVKEYLVKGGAYTEEEIEEVIEEYVDNDKLYKKSKIAANKLKENYSKKKEKLIEEQKQKATEQQKQQEQYANEVSETIKKGSFAGFNIPETEKSRFNKYVFGNKREEKHKNLSLDKKLLIEYLVYNDFDISKLIKASKSTSIGNRFRKPATERLGTRSKTNKGKTNRFDIVI